MSKEIIIIMILLVISLGTIWNYISLRISVTNYWKIVNPNMKKKDVKQVLRILHDLDMIRDMYQHLDEVTKEYDELESRIVESLQLLITALSNFKIDVTDIYKHVKNNTKAAAIKYLHDYDFSASIGLVDSVLSKWPEYVSKSDELENITQTTINQDNSESM